MGFPSFLVADVGQDAAAFGAEPKTVKSASLAVEGPSAVDAGVDVEGAARMEMEQVVAEASEGIAAVAVARHNTSAVRSAASASLVPHTCLYVDHDRMEMIQMLVNSTEGYGIPADNAQPPPC